MNLSRANIPLNKLQNIQFRNFLQLYTQKYIPNESTIKMFYLDDCYDKIMKTIRQSLCLKIIWLSIDESTNAKGRQFQMP